MDEYHSLLELAGEDDNKRFNDIRRELDQEVFDIRDTNEYHRFAPPTSRAFLLPQEGEAPEGRLRAAPQAGHQPTYREWLYRT